MKIKSCFQRTCKDTIYSCLYAKKNRKTTLQLTNQFKLLKTYLFLTTCITLYASEIFFLAFLAGNLFQTSLYLTL